jgi:DNA-3-methyladenine glycosylase I
VSPVEQDRPGIEVGEDGVARCWWSASDALLEQYHDLEWGRPTADDRHLFEMLTLEGFQSGLSWLTILRKRDNFKKAFRNFDIGAVGRFNPRSVERLLNDAGIVRNRAKIEATINNALRCRELVEDFGSLAAYVWRFEPKPSSRPLLDRASLMQITQNDESVSMSKDLRKRGWSFVGPTTVYSFMEAVGLVNDHLDGCKTQVEVERERKKFRRPSAWYSDSRRGG